MPNIERKSSDYVYLVSPQQLDQLLSLALSQDRTVQEMILEAIDDYIKREQNR